MPSHAWVPLDTALAQARAAILDAGRFVRAVGAGRQHGQTPRWVRVTLRPVMLKAGQALQIVTDDGARPTTRNLAWGEPAAAAVDELLAEPYGNWHVWTVQATLQIRVSKKGQAYLRLDPASLVNPERDHDLPRRHLLDPGDELFDVLGATAAKRRQVDAFLRALDATLNESPDQLAQSLRRPLRVVDLGCGNAYLTFAAYRYLTQERGLPVQLVGVDVREDQRVRNSELAARLGWADSVRFEASTIGGASMPAPDLVLALHACDTATDEALARGVRWGSRYLLAAPCCHHDLAAQLRRSPSPPPYGALTRSGILRERLADVLTDSLRAMLLRLHGYHVDVVEFVDSQHTPRNLLLRARHTGVAAPRRYRDEYTDLVRSWQITPKLAELLGDVGGMA